MSNITRPQMTRKEATAFYELRRIGGGCANAGLEWFEYEIERPHATGSELESNLRGSLMLECAKSLGLQSKVGALEEAVTELESNLHHAVTEGAKTCNKLNDVIQSKQASIEAGHGLLMEESADNSHLVGKINSIHRWYCWSIFAITSAAIASHFIWG